MIEPPAPAHHEGDHAADPKAAVRHPQPIWSPSAIILVTMAILGGVVAPLVLAAVTGGGSGQGSGPVRALHVDLRWWVEERTGDANGNGVPDWEDPTEVNPPSWRVYFRAAGWNCQRSRAIRWEIDGAPGPSGVCRFYHDFPTLGRHDVGFSAVSASGASGSYDGVILVRDWLVVSIGDSVASGEGNPPWTNKRCRRSDLAGPALAAELLRAHDNHTTVSFLHLACTGATVLKGLLRPQFSGVSGQIEQVGADVGPRPIDALLLSIGANDIGFAKIATACALHRHCTTRRDVLDHVRDLDRLPHWYKRLNLCLTGSRTGPPCFTLTNGAPLRPLGVAPDRVFITEYFDPTRDGNGLTCNRILLPWPGGIDRSELEWLQIQVLRPLNEAVAAAAGMHGWHYVGGIVDAFRTHGYCSEDSWIVHLGRAALRWNFSGPLHPNALGHAEGYAPAILAALDEVLYPTK